MAAPDAKHDSKPRALPPAPYDVAVIVEREGKFITEAADRDDRPAVPHDSRAAAEAYLQSSGLVQAKVRPGGRYARMTGGAVLWVTEREYSRVRHTLISLADERAEAAKAPAVPAATEAQIQFRSFRQGFRGAARMRDEAAQERRRQEFRALGFEPKQSPAG